MLRWNTKAIIRFCHGRQGITDICAKSDPLAVPPNPGTISVWQHRGAIAAQWLPAIVEHCLDHGMSVNDLFQDDRADVSLNDMGL